MSTTNQTTLHYGGSLRAGGASSTPGISPSPVPRKRGAPNRNTSFQAQKRFELMARLENAALPEAAIAPMLNISVARLRYLKKMPEYLIVRMRITHGIILDQDAKIAEIKEQRKELLVQLLPPALQTLANTLLSQPSNYAERKLQIDVAKDVLDRSDIFAKVSRTELKPVSFFDFEKTDKDSEDVIKVLKSASAHDLVGESSCEASRVEGILLDSESFSSQSESLSEEDQQEALKSLEELT